MGDDEKPSGGKPSSADKPGDKATPGDKAKPAPQAPEVPPWLPLPDDFKEFIACKRDSIQLGGDEQKTALKDVSVKFTPDPKRKRHFKITIKGLKAAGGDALPDPLELDASVDPKGFHLHTRGRDDIPGPVKTALKEFCQGFNEFLKGSGKKFGDVEKKDGKLVLSKVASVAMNMLPTWEKAGAGALMALVTIGGFAGMNIGDSTSTRTVGTPSVVADGGGDGSSASDGPVALNGGYCAHHDQTSEIELQFIVPSALNGHRIDASYETGPRGGAATGQGVVNDGFVSIPLDITGRGPGEYRGLTLRDFKLDLPLRYEYEPPDPAFITPEGETACPGKSVLAGDQAWIGAFSAGANHNPGAQYTSFEGDVLAFPSVWLNCLTINAAPPGAWVRFTGESATGAQVEGSGAVDANGRVVVASGISKFGNYRVASAELIDPIDFSLRQPLDVPALLGDPYTITGPETPCNPGGLPPGMLRTDERSEPTPPAEPEPDSAADPGSETVTEETDALPWSVVVAAGVDVGVLGLLFRDKVRRQGRADQLPPLFGPGQPMGGDMTDGDMRAIPPPGSRLTVEDLDLPPSDLAPYEEPLTPTPPEDPPDEVM